MTFRRIRVLLCSSSMDGGGSERQLLYLLRGLDRDRFEPQLYLLYDTGVLLDELPADVPRHAFWNDVSTPKWNWPGRIHGMQVRHLSRIIREERIDVVYDRLFHMTLVTGPATANTRTPRVSTIVSPPQFDLERNEKRWLHLKRRALHRAYNTAAALLTVAPGTADSASQYYQIDRAKFRVMLSPIDIERIERDAEAALELRSFPADTQHICSVGRLSDEKGHRYLVEGVASYLRTHLEIGLPAIRLHLVGDGVLRKELESLVARLGIEANVEFHGQTSNPFAIMRRCQLFCMPSLYEGMPNALLEAMACGVPVLATNTEQGPGELLREKPIGTLVPRSDANAICEAIRDRFSNPQPWLDRAVLANHYVREHHNLNRWIDSMSKLFEEVIENSPDLKREINGEERPLSLIANKNE